MLLIISKFWVPKGFSGITIFPFIFAREKSCKSNETFINHEKIHIWQQLELLVVFFFIWYGLEFLIRLVQYKDFRNAYQNISFEREAYTHERNLTYLTNRRFFSFIKYL